MTRELDLHKSTVSRLLAVLETRGLVRREGRGFAPGPELARLGALALSSVDVREAAREPLERLARETGETVNLAVREGDQALNVDQVQTAYFVGATDWTGRGAPLHATANGKVLLAFGRGPLPDELPALTIHTITDRPELLAALEAVRGRGYATALGELELGLHAVAAPVFDSVGNCVAAVSVSGPSYRLTRERLEKAAERCVAAADEISKRLGYRRAA